MEYTVNFNVDTVVKGHHNYTYRGIKSIKCPFDYALYQMIIFDVKPDLIIEIGTNHGGSSLYLSDMLDIIGKGVIHTIDIMEYPLSDLVKNNKRIKRFVSPNGFKDYDINYKYYVSETMKIIDKIDGKLTKDMLKISGTLFDELN